MMALFGGCAMRDLSLTLTQNKEVYMKRVLIYGDSVSSDCGLTCDYNVYSMDLHGYLSLRQLVLPSERKALVAKCYRPPKKVAVKLSR